VQIGILEHADLHIVGRGALTVVLLWPYGRISVVA
jgi:hypothetical protein